MKTLYSILLLIVGGGFVSAQETQNLASSQPIVEIAKSSTQKEVDSKNQKLASDESLMNVSNKGNTQSNQFNNGKAVKLASESEIIPPKTENK